MILSLIFVCLSIACVEVFDSLVPDPVDPVALPKQPPPSFDQRLFRVYGHNDLSGVRLRLMWFVNWTSDVLFVAGVLTISQGWFFIGWLLWGGALAAWLLGVGQRFDFAPPQREEFGGEPVDSRGIVFGQSGTQEATVAGCAVCGESLVGIIVICKKCDMPHHKDCWNYLGKCSVYGCGCQSSRRQTRKEIIEAREGRVDRYEPRH